MEENKESTKAQREALSAAMKALDLDAATIDRVDGVHDAFVSITKAAAAISKVEVPEGERLDAGHILCSAIHAKMVNLEGLVDTLEPYSRGGEQIKAVMLAGQVFSALELAAYAVELAADGEVEGVASFTKNTKAWTE